MDQKPPKVSLRGLPPDPYYTGPSPRPQTAAGHTDYWVLPDEERSKGFVRPIRNAYRHTRCGGATKIHTAIAETLARDPEFYLYLYCATCCRDYPAGKEGEFVWYTSGEKVGA